jgi:hypothetical protein
MTAIDPSGQSDPPAEREVGTMVLSVSVEKDHVLLTNKTRMNSPDGKEFVEYSVQCRCSVDGRLMFQSCETEVVQGDGTKVFEAQTSVAKGLMVHKFTEEGKEDQDYQEFVEGTIVDLAVFFLVPQLSLAQDASIPLENVMALPINRIEQPQPRKITCLGIDSLASSGEQKLTKFINAAQNDDGNILYWVDQNKTLTRVLLSPTNRLDLKAEQKNEEPEPTILRDVQLQALRSQVMVQMKTLERACEIYKIQLGHLPAKLEHLYSLPKGMSESDWKGPYLAQDNHNDVWGRPYSYDIDVTTDKAKITSRGPDGKLGNDDDISISK